MAVSAELITKRKEFEAKQDKLKSIFKEAGENLDLTKVTSLPGDTKAKAAEIKKMNDELSAMGKEIDSLVDLENAAKDNDTREKSIEQAQSKGFQIQHPGISVKEKTLGEQFTETTEFKNYGKTHGRQIKEFNVELKTLMSTSAGYAPESLREGPPVEMVRRPPDVLDLIRIQPTTMAAILYMEQTTRTSNASEVTEGSGTTTDAALAYTERSVTVQEILEWLPVTSQQLEDVPEIRGIIDTELPQMLRERIDYQIINGTGLTIYLAGLLNNSGIQTGTYSGDWMDTVHNQIKKIRVTGRSTADSIIFNPEDWSEIRLKRTEDGLYILGNPNEPVERLWGLQVVQTDAIAAKTNLVGAFRTWTSLREKRGVQIEITDSHDTYFIYGKYAIKATVRVALVTKRPAAFCKVVRP